MTRRDWWLGVLALALVLVMHSAFPRYDWQQLPNGMLARIDRWTGEAVLGRWEGAPDRARRWVGP